MEEAHYPDGIIVATNYIIHQRPFFFRVSSATNDAVQLLQRSVEP
jgi:hypothetical protein